jgi:hypothetical protein
MLITVCNTLADVDMGPFLFLDNANEGASYLGPNTTNIGQT